MSIFSKADTKHSKKIMEEILEIDRNKAEIVAEMVPLIKDFYEKWHSEAVIEKRLYKLFSQPQKDKIMEKEESAYTRDLDDLKKEKEDLSQIQRLVKILESYNEDLIKKLNQLNS